jgi:hypothetical protein
MYHINLNLKQSQNIVGSFHRHSKPLARHMFSIGAVKHRGCIWSECFGIVTVDRCSSAWSKRRDHVEIRRLCTTPDAPKNTASYLIARAKDACFAMGYRCIITYTKPTELGASLKAAGFYLQKAKWIPGKPDHPKGLLQWICVRDHQPNAEQRAFTRDGLKQIQEDMNVRVN